MPLYTVLVTFSDFATGIEQVTADSAHSAVQTFIKTAECLEEYDRDQLTRDSFSDKRDPLIHVANGLHGFWIWVIANSPKDSYDTSLYGGYVIQTDTSGPLRPSA